MKTCSYLPCISLLFLGCVSCISVNTGKTGVSVDNEVSSNTSIMGDSVNIGNTVNNRNTDNTHNTIKKGDSVYTSKTGDTGDSVNSGVSRKTVNGRNTVKTGNTGITDNSVISGDSSVEQVRFRGFVGEPVSDIPQVLQRASGAERWSPRNMRKLAGVVETGPASTFSLPIRYAPVVGVISSEFGSRANRIHKGVDFKAAYGSRVFAYADGVVVRSHYSASYGHVVEILHAGGWSTLYAHLSRRYLEIGEVAHQGGLLGLVGQSGHATGPHVHFEVRFRGQAINPLENRPAVLLAAR